jgi:hypothetical protein
MPRIYLYININMDNNNNDFIESMRKTGDGMNKIGDSMKTISYSITLYLKCVSNNFLEKS